MFLHEYSNFPEQPIQPHHFKDVDDSIAMVINEINELQTKGLYNQASRIIENNKDVLAPYIVDSKIFNEWDEHIYNAQVYALQNQQCIYTSETEPDFICKNDVWIGGD